MGNSSRHCICPGRALSDVTPTAICLRLTTSPANALACFRSSLKPTCWRRCRKSLPDARAPRTRGSGDPFDEGRLVAGQLISGARNSCRWKASESQSCRKPRQPGSCWSTLSMTLCQRRPAKKQAVQRTYDQQLTAREHQVLRAHVAPRARQRDNRLASRHQRADGSQSRLDDLQQARRQHARTGDRLGARGRIWP